MSPCYVDLMASDTAPAKAPFRRDRATWVCYLLLGYFSLMVGATGALLPSLRLELGLTFTQASQHPSVYAVGLLLASFVTGRLSSRLGSRTLLWGGAVGMAAGAAVVMAAPSFFWSLFGFFLMGGLGALTLIEVSATLSALHGPNRARAIGEANVLASFCTVLAPLCVGGAVATGLGWRVGVGLVPAALLVIGAVFWRTPVPQTAPPGRTVAGRLPGRFWRFWTLLILCVAVEFGVLFWAAEYLQDVGFVTPATAPLGLSAFFLAMLLGRAAGTRLAGRVGDKPLLLVSLGLALAGFLAYWLGGAAWAQFAGLFVCGLGVANLYPFTISLALGSVSGPSGRASARASFGSGLAILLAPFALGALADLSSLRAAQTVLPVCLILAAANVFWAMRAPVTSSSPNAVPASSRKNL